MRSHTKDFPRSAGGNSKSPSGRAPWSGIFIGEPRTPYFLHRGPLGIDTYEVLVIEETCFINPFLYDREHCEVLPQPVFAFWFFLNRFAPVSTALCTCYGVNSTLAQPGAPFLTKASVGRSRRVRLVLIFLGMVLSIQATVQWNERLGGENFIQSISCVGAGAK